MSAIGGIGSSASAAWSEMRSARAEARRAQMFAKADADGSGGIDASELQTVLARLSETSGGSLGDAEEQFSAMDGDGDGSLSSEELDSGLKSLLPPPSSTLEFAQRMGGGGPGGQGGMPPPPGADEEETGSSVDALDSNGDGVVSLQERLAGELQEALQGAIEASDSDGDGTLSADEAESFGTQLASAFTQALESLGTGDASAEQQDDSQAGSSQAAAFDPLASLMLRQYAGLAGNWQNASPALDLMAA
ncbi:MAG TPA: EF-hand domain-containing protein [Roseateles sp.]|nr:EF-hand domain-containing protein [Roseateles sp.]